MRGIPNNCVFSFEISIIIVISDDVTGSLGPLHTSKWTKCCLKSDYSKGKIIYWKNQSLAQLRWAKALISCAIGNTLSEKI